MGAEEEPSGDQTNFFQQNRMDVEDQEIEAPVEAEPVVEAEPLDTVSALKQVLKKALCQDGLARGIRECARMLDKRRVHLCILPDNTELGEWAGLCKIDAEGNARKVVSCSCVCITDYGEQSEALNYLLKELGKDE